MNKLEVKGLCRSFGKFKALDDVSFAVPAGAVYGFIGPNGAGKTTCLRILAGLDEPSAGTILINGQDLSCYPERIRKEATLMPDTLPNLSDMRVWEYLDFVGRAFGKNAAERKKSMDYICDLTDVGRMLEQRLCTLSKGMKQQVSLARMLLSDANILLLDEPAAGLDPKARIELRKTMATISAEGKTLLISSHILTELEDMVSGMVLLDQGKMIFSGSLESIANARKDAKVQILVTLQAEAEKFVSLLNGVSWIAAANVHSPKQILISLNPEITFENAMAELFKLGLPISGFVRHDTGLEGLFMNATGIGAKKI